MSKTVEEFKALTAEEQKAALVELADEMGFAEYNLALIPDDADLVELYVGGLADLEKRQAEAGATAKAKSGSAAKAKAPAAENMLTFLKTTQFKDGKTKHFVKKGESLDLNEIKLTARVVKSLKADGLAK